MKVKYSEHIKNRLRFRKIDNDLPKIIFEQPEDKYFDKETGHFIAVKNINLYNKNREVMVAYTFHEDYPKSTIKSKTIWYWCWILA